MDVWGLIPSSALSDCDNPVLIYTRQVKKICLLHRNGPVLQNPIVRLIIQPLTWLRWEEYFFLLSNIFGREIRKEVVS